jgi:broad specificity phosphatase PhoE
LIISSPAARAIQTAENIRVANGSNCKIAKLNSLRGIRVNDREEWNRLKERVGRDSLMSMWSSGKLDPAIIDSFEAVMGRIVSEIRSEISRNGSENVLVVSHDHMVNALHHYFLGAPEGRVGLLGGFSIDIRESEMRDAPITARGG